MLRIYDEAVEVLRLLTPIIANLARRDPDLARQLRRCSASVVLNIAEGSYARGGNRRALFAVAFGSLKETRACLDVADAFGYAPVDPDIARRLHAIGAPLHRLTA